MAGKPFRKNLRGPFGIMGRSSGRESFEDSLSLYLNENGGDFQFTADTEIVIVRRRIDGNGKYTIHKRSIQIIDLVPGLVNEDCETFEISGE